MTEVGPITATKGQTWKEVEAALGSAGTPLYGIEVTVIGPDGKRRFSL